MVLPEEIATGLADAHVLHATQFVTVIRDIARVAEKCVKYCADMVDFFDHEINARSIERPQPISTEDFSLLIFDLEGLLASMDTVSRYLLQLCTSPLT